MTMLRRFKRIDGSEFKPSDNKLPCEACRGTMTGHIWVDMDRYGFVVKCERKPKDESKGK